MNTQTSARSASARYVSLLDEVRRRNDAVPAGVRSQTFDVECPDGLCATFGQGAPVASVTLNNDAGVSALESFDDLTVAEAYMNGDIDLDGDMVEILKLRSLLTDRRVLRYVWSTYLQPRLLGQERCDKRWISEHYDLPTDFFLLFLDKRVRGYSHAFFESDDEPLADAMERKFRYAIKAANIRPGDRVLDVGGGWGSFLELAGGEGVRVTSLTISDESEKYMTDLVSRKKLPCEVVRRHLTEYRSERKFDAIVNFGVTEHIPDYHGSVRQYADLLKPGGRVYLDSCTGDRYKMATVTRKWVFNGNGSPLCLRDYLDALSRTDLEVIRVQDDRHNYYLTSRRWAENLEAAHAEVSARWGETLYRRFRMFLWGCASAFHEGLLGAHHVVLENRAGMRSLRDGWMKWLA